MHDIRRKLKRKLLKTDTVERCGLVLAGGKIVQVDNLHDNPAVGFRIAGKEMLRAGVVGTWHTHPNKTSVLSQEDYNGFLNWPGLDHYVVGIDGVRGYHADGEILREFDVAAD